MRDNTKGGALTEVTFYILLSLYTPKHGYAVMQFIEEKTGGRLDVYKRQEQCQHHGDDHRIGNDHHGHKALAVEKGQCIRQLAEVIVFIVSHAAHKTGDDAHEYAHIQSRGTEYGSEVTIDSNLLSEQRMGCLLYTSDRLHQTGFPSRSDMPSVRPSQSVPEYLPYS